MADKLGLDQLHFSFLPSWWHRNYGVSFGERYVFDPDYRVEIIRFAERTVRERFPELHIGSEEPKPKVSQPDFNNTTTPALAGCEVHYPVDNFPWNCHLPAEDIAKLRAPEDLRAHFPYSEIISQVAYLNRKLGQEASPWLPTRGVLNDAMLIQGSEVFADLLAEPEKARRLLAFAANVASGTIRHNQADHAGRSMACLTNCSNMMVSPRQYRQLLFPYELDLFRECAGRHLDFAIHHCGCLDAYGEHYQAFPAIAFMEIGWGSDLRRALEMFPNTIIQYIFSATFLRDSGSRPLGAKVESILEAARGFERRFRLSVPDIEADTPDENVKIVYECCKRGNEKANQ